MLPQDLLARGFNIHAAKIKCKAWYGPDVSDADEGVRAVNAMSAVSADIRALKWSMGVSSLYLFCCSAIPRPYMFGVISFEVTNHTKKRNLLKKLLTINSCLLYCKTLFTSPPIPFFLVMHLRICM